MRILAVYAHPSPQSFNHSLLQALIEESERKKHQCVVRDLYREKFQPVLSEKDFEAFNHGDIPADIKAEQEEVKNAEVLVFIHPVWWFGFPAILKGWVDRVFSYGFAYGHDSRGVKPLLTGKKALIFNTTGAPRTSGYIETGTEDAMEKLIDVGIYQFVGLEVLLHRMLYQVPTAADEERRAMLEKVRSDLRKFL